MLEQVVVEPASDVPSTEDFTRSLERWLAAHPDVLEPLRTPRPSYADRVEAMSTMMGTLFDEGWSRVGWPAAVGGRGGSIKHRAAMWEALARHGVPSMALFEHLEVLGPTLVEMADPTVAARLFPAFLRGEQFWCQGFSEPDSGSDLASIRTRASADGEAFTLAGRKIWTSWARYARWCLVLARTGVAADRHRGLTAFIVDLRSPGVEVRPILQANGTDELAEVTFDDVTVPSEHIVGTIDGGWQVAMHILSHERGTFAWFRHCFLYRRIAEHLVSKPPADDLGLGEALLDLASVTALGRRALDSHAEADVLGPRSAFTKLMLCAAERSVYDWVLDTDGDIRIGLQDDSVATARQDYLFSRIVTVYGGSQEMQLETIAKQVLQLP